MVEFKSGRTDFYYSADTFLQYKLGDLVMVEADRGKDLGKIVSEALTFDQMNLLQKCASNENINGSKEIYGLAHEEEAELMYIKWKDERRALNVCIQKTKNRNLPMEIIDAEYQWDRKKLTFYYTSRKRIDFRELIRDLFKIYRTRIWM
ncbi:PSP1 C-terminal conserved region-domain-containing protein [Sporodiniella umbellata]|nr:PSP1 C-terminal conserved region-domain-containing protein [Sporodiniella umbellata]